MHIHSNTLHVFVYTVKPARKRAIQSKLQHFFTRGFAPVSWREARLEQRVG